MDQSLRWEKVDVKIPTENSRPVVTSSGKDFSFYEQNLQNRDVFKLPWEEPAKEQGSSSVAQVSSLSDQIKIKGILLDQDPKVVLEDVATHQTSILSVGENINGAVLKAIQADKVIFNYNNQDVELIPW